MAPPDIVAVVNVTEDSFSDGGRYLAPDAALAHARGLAEAGAAVIELGPAASHPEAARISPAEQIARLRPILGRLRADGLTISVDATEPEVLRFALETGADWLNDIRGFPNPDFYPDLALAPSRLVVMAFDRGERPCHARARGARAPSRFDRSLLRRATLRARPRGRRRGPLGGRPRDGLLPRPRSPELDRRAEAPTGPPRALRSARPDLGLAQVVPAQSLGVPLEAIGPANLAAELFAARNGADFIRTHDVRALRDGLAIEAALAEQS